MKAVATFHPGAKWSLLHSMSLTGPNWMKVASVEVFTNNCEVSIELPESKGGFVKFEQEPTAQ